MEYLITEAQTGKGERDFELDEAAVPVGFPVAFNFTHQTLRGGKQEMFVSRSRSDSRSFMNRSTCKGNTSK